MGKRRDYIFHNITEMFLSTIVLHLDFLFHYLPTDNLPNYMNGYNIYFTIEGLIGLH